MSSRRASWVHAARKKLRAVTASAATCFHRVGPRARIIGFLRRPQLVEPGFFDEPEQLRAQGRWLGVYLDRLDEADGQDEGGTGGGEVENIEEKIAATRRLENVRGEFSITALAYNIRRAISLVGVPALIAAARA